MENAILTKLRLKLAEPPQNEADVVYILVEIRKYLDHTDPKGGQYTVLRTYCDWPVHIILDRRGAKNLLQELDDAFAAPAAERKKALKTVFNKFSLTEFLNEMRGFLRSTGLPTRLIEDRVWWGQFLTRGRCDSGSGAEAATPQRCEDHARNIRPRRRRPTTRSRAESFD